MSKLYLMNRMAYSPAAGGIALPGILVGAGKLVGGLFKSKAAKAMALATKTALARPDVRMAIAAGAGGLAGQLLMPGGGAQVPGKSQLYSSQSWYGWRRRRGRGITATELRGYRKVANLIHKEGMVSKRARGRK